MAEHYSEAELQQFRRRKTGTISKPVPPQAQLVDNNVSFSESMEVTRHHRARVQRDPSARTEKMRSHQRFISRGDDDFESTTNYNY